MKDIFDSTSMWSPLRISPPDVPPALPPGIDPQLCPPRDICTVVGFIGGPFKYYLRVCRCLLMGNHRKFAYGQRTGGRYHSCFESALASGKTTFCGGPHGRIASKSSILSNSKPYSKRVLGSKTGDQARTFGEKNQR